MSKANKPKPKKTINKQERNKIETSEASTSHESFKLSALPKIDNTGLPSSFSLLWSTLKDTYKYRWRTFFFILSYGLPWYLLTESAGNEPADAAYGLFFGTIAILASIWMIRHREAGDKVTIRAAYYRGMTQLIPFFLVGLFMALQLVPGYLGFAIYETVTASGAVVTGIEIVVPIVIWVFLAIISFYWVTASLMSLYVSTIPGALPFESIKAGRRLVDGRRWFIFRRLVIFSSFNAGIYLLFIYWFAHYEWQSALAALSTIFPIVIIPFINTYLYKVYSGLLKKNR